MTFSHVGICVSDLERSTAFYRDALGFEAAELHQIGPEFGGLMEVDGVRLRSQFMRRDNVAIELLFYESPGATGPSTRRAMTDLGLTHLSFRVDDVGTAAALVRAHGGTVVDDTRTTFGDSLDFVYCTDPDGTRIELMKLG